MISCVYAHLLARHVRSGFDNLNICTVQLCRNRDSYSINLVCSLLYMVHGQFGNIPLNNVEAAALKEQNKSFQCVHCLNSR